MEQQPWQEVYDFIGTNSSANNTPTPTATLSTVSEAMPLRERNISQDDHNARSTPTVQVLENPPIANRPLMIRTKKDPHLYITLCDGEVKLLPNPTSTDGSFWYCVRTGGWYGFRNTVSGTFLGRHTAGSIYAAQRFHSANEYFTVERDVNGGYIMHVFSSQDTRLIPVSISEDTHSLIHGKEEGVAWEFIGSK